MKKRWLTISFFILINTLIAFILITSIRLFLVKAIIFPLIIISVIVSLIFGIVFLKEDKINMLKAISGTIISVFITLVLLVMFMFLGDSSGIPGWS